MAWDVSTGPGITALGLAAARSVESGRPDRLIEDPFARRLFDAAGTDLPMLVDWPDADREVTDAEALNLHGSRYIGLRTRFYDDLLLDAARNGVGQGVLIGAGLDTRAWRLELSESFRLFELDQADVLDYKDEVFTTIDAEPRCDRTAIGADLRDGWTVSLEAAGFDATAPAVWIAEGLMPYLAPEAQVGLLEVIHGLSAPASVLAFDRIAGDVTAGGRARELSERSGIDMESLFAGGDSGDPAALLRARGWETEQASTAHVALRYGRDLRDPFGHGEPTGEPPWLETVFLTATL